MAEPVHSSILTPPVSRRTDGLPAPQHTKCSCLPPSSTANDASMAGCVAGSMPELGVAPAGEGLVVGGAGALEEPSAEHAPSTTSAAIAGNHPGDMPPPPATRR